MKTRGYSHQLDATEWMLPRDVGALFSIMGAGKSWVIMNLLERLGIEEAVIICEKSGLHSWREEVKKHTNLRSVFFNVYKRQTTPAPRLYIFNYEKFITRGPTLFCMFRPMWENGAVILDESVRIKNEKSKTSKSILIACKGFKKRFIVSGLPIPESPMDIYNQYKFLGMPFVRKMSRWEFRNFFMEETMPFTWEFRENKKDLFWRWVNENCFRVNEDDLDLPAKNFNEVYYELTLEQKAMYNDLYHYWEADLDGQIMELDFVFAMIAKLRQVCSGFIYDENKEPHFFRPFNKAKGEAFVGLMDKLLAQKDNVVVWYNFKPEQTIIRELLEQCSYDYYPSFIDGQTSDKKRSLYLNRFQAGEQQVLVAQIQTIAKSVTLTSSRYGVYFSLPVPGDLRQQSIKRLHRIGQKRPVFYYDLIGLHTIEERIWRSLKKKESWAQFLKGVDREGLRLGR